MSAGLAASTVTPGRTAPLVSLHHAGDAAGLRERHTTAEPHARDGDDDGEPYESAHIGLRIKIPADTLQDLRACD